MEGLREARQACQSANAKVKIRAISLISEAALAFAQLWDGKLVDHRRQGSGE
jgi:hypothetical protein